MGLWKVAAPQGAAHRRSKPARASEGAGRIFQVSGQRGSRAAQSLRRDNATLWRPVLSEPTAGPLKRTPLHDAASRAGRAPGALRRLRDAGAVPGRHPGRACCRRATAAGLFDVSHMGQVRLTAKPGAERGQGARDAGAGRHRGPAARPAALHAVHQRRRRHPRRPDGDHAPAIICCWSSMPPARTPTSRICRRTCSATLRDRADVLARAAGAAGPAGRRRCWRGWRRRSRA